MSYEPDSKSSADLEREVQAQRDRVEARIGEIKDRLSPGQLIDEALAYTKDGGSHFAANLGSTISANPLPAALLGVSLVWLMSGQGKSQSQSEQQPMRAQRYDQPDYPYARASGNGLRRTAHRADEAGQWWSEFETGDGGRYKAKSNEKGDRLGHFADDTGKFFGGFIDDAGNRIKQFQDEAGNVIDDAAGWASHAWSDMRHGIGDTAQSVTDGAQQLGREMQKQSDQLTQQIGRLFEQQPLIAGALAFAAGATLGAALPHTREEDKLVGKQGDKLRSEARHAAGDLYEKGKETVVDAYDGVADTASEVYDDVKERIAGGNDSGSEGADARPATFARH
jgi:ElaB/YqjD/DUF883 family membrane-anchored ribosome-binding protein